jgi:hypothetical protein
MLGCNFFKTGGMLGCIEVLVSETNTVIIIVACFILVLRFPHKLDYPMTQTSKTTYVWKERNRIIVNGSSESGER